jgi:hypothetical protein
MSRGMKAWVGGLLTPVVFFVSLGVFDRVLPDFMRPAGRVLWTFVLSLCCVALMWTGIAALRRHVGGKGEGNRS